MPAAPLASGSDFYEITNISGNTGEGGTTATFKVKLDESPAHPTPSASPYMSGSDLFEVSDISGHTSEAVSYTHLTLPTNREV